nr:2-dehydro-3-deoxygalactonokinase [Sphingorhabdus sp.]
GKGYEVALASIHKQFGEMPVLLAGMAGSTIGWLETSYVPAPTDLDQLASALHVVDAHCAIIPGVRFEGNGRADIMRGEEVQLLGACLIQQVPPTALLCQPGTHSKWAWMEGGALSQFSTAMTGELFALLRDHSLIAGQLTGVVELGPAFRRGVEEGAKRDLLTSLFGVRARSMVGLLDPVDATAYTSGLLIGSEVAAQPLEGEIAHIIAERALGGLYIEAIRILGGKSVLIDSEAAFVAGMTRIMELCR